MSKAKAIAIGVGALGGLALLALAGGSSADDKKKAQPGTPVIPPIIPGGPPMPPPQTFPTINLPEQIIFPTPTPGKDDRPTGASLPPDFGLPPDFINSGFNLPTGQGFPTPTGPVGRFGTVKPGEGPYAFVSRVSGGKYAARQPNGHWGWHDLESVNPSLQLNDAGDRYTDETWKPGMQIRIPDAWPGGMPGISGGAGNAMGSYF